MKSFLTCRRTFVGCLAIACLTFLGFQGADNSEWIASVAMALAAANSYERTRTK